MSETFTDTFDLDDPAFFREHWCYSDWTATLAGRLVEDNPMLRHVVNGIAVELDDPSEFGGLEESVLSEMLTGRTPVLYHLRATVGSDEELEQWVRDNTFGSNEGPVVDLVLDDLRLELREFVKAKSEDLH